jgi:hypothetical protein
MFMQTYSVNVVCDVTAKVLDHPFRYRVYVNNELFTERTWIWQGVYLEEMLPISAPAGVYPIRFETVDPAHGRLKVRNYRINDGTGSIIMYQGETAVEISNESQ